MNSRDASQPNFQPISLALGGLAGVVGALFFETRPWVAGGLFVFAAALTVLTLVGGGRRDRRRLLRWMLRRDNAFLYETLVTRIVGTVTRMLTPKTAEEEPKPYNRIARFGWYKDPRARDAADRDALMGSAFSWPTMDAALKLAATFPLFLMLVQWAWTNDPTGIGALTVLEPAPLWARLATTGPAAAYLVCRMLASASLQGVFGKLADWLFWIASAVTGAGAVAGAVAVAVAGAVAGAFPSAFGFAAAAAIGLATQRRRGRIAYALFAVSGLLSVAFVLASTAGSLSAEFKVLVFALGILPLANAVFDVLSYGVTLSLLRKGLRGGRWPTLAWGTLDLFVAVAILYGLALFLAGIVAAINAASATPLLPLEPLFADLASPETRGGYAWLYLSLLSTLVPTAVHLFAVLLSALTWAPHRLKLWIVAKIREPEADLSSLAGIVVFALLLTGYVFLLAFAAIEALPWILANFEAGAMWLLRAVAWTMGVPLPTPAAPA